MTRVRQLIPLTCEYCRFSRIKANAGVRQCRVYSPQIASGSVFDPANARWPVVDDTDWCGEYEPVQRGPEPPASVVEAS